MSCPSDFTVEELIAYLKRSDLPAVLVEGRDDMTIYRWVEDASTVGLGAVIPCGGRSQVLEIARRQQEIAPRKVAFLIDSDSDSVWETEEDIENAIWTEGYSIENDLFATGVISQLMTSEEKNDFEQVVDLLTAWFLNCLICVKEGSDAKLCCHSREVVDHKSLELRSDFTIDEEFEEKYRDACSRVRDHPLKFIRGKNLFDSSLVYLSDRGRRSKYSRQNLYELCAINYDKSSELVERLSQIQQILAQ